MAPVLRKRKAKALVESDSEPERPKKPRHADNASRIHAPSNKSGATKEKGRRVKKSLRNMLEMPLDVVYEILAYLNPADLVHLRKVNDVFHEFLSSPSAGLCWSTARSNWEEDNTNLPERPHDMSEVAFLEYLFAKYCHNCQKSLGTTNVCWEARRRYCKACREQITAKLKYSHPATITDILPAKFGHERESQIIFGWNIRNVLPIICADVDRHGAPIHPSRCQFPYVEDALQDLKTELDNLSTIAEVVECIERRNRELASRYESEIPAIAFWFAAKKRDRTKVLRQARDARFKDIMSRLKALGWAEEIQLMDYNTRRDFRSLPVMKLSKPMTDRAWKNGQLAPIEFLEEVKRMRLEAQRKETTLSRVKSFLEAASKMLSPKPGVPSPFDIALDIPMVREIIEQPVEVEVTQSSFEPIRDLLPAFVVQWQQNAKAGFADLVRSRVDLPPDVDPLSLAVGTYFKCGRCHGAWFTYEEAFEHDCQHQDISQLFRWETDPLKVALLSARRAWGRMWRPGCFVAIGAMVQSIAKLIGKDPTRVTAAELDESPLRFACKGCDTRSHFASAVTVFGWRQICQHVGCRLGDDEGLYVVSDAVAAAAKSCEPAVEASELIRLELVYERDRKDHFCMHCYRDFKRLPQAERNEIVQHVKDEHGVSEPQLEKDYAKERAGREESFPMRRIKRIVVTLYPPVLPASSQLSDSCESDLREGRALVYDFENDCVADREMPVYV